MIEFAAITSVISKYAPQASQLIIKQGQKNQAIIKIFQELNLNPTQISDDVDVVYAHALVKYGVFKPEPILKLFEEKKIKDAFWGAYTANAPFDFLDNTRKFLNENSELKTQIINSTINLLGELEEFGEVFIAVSKLAKAKKFEPYPDWNLDVYPKEFKALIFEKTRLFCGRDFVFQAILKFISTKAKGYFTVIGDAGMGKSAIAAKFILNYKCPCYFNIFAEGRNKPEQFLASIRQQLIKRYSLQNADKADLPTLLQKASEKLTPGQRLVIVVDALDEVKQEENSNLLDLPQSLPNGVYFLLTRRHYNQETKRLTLSPDTPGDELDLTQDDYTNLSQEDIKEYIHLFLNMSKSELKQWIQQLYQNQAKNNEGIILNQEIIALSEWIQKQNPQIEQKTFIEQLAEKSQNNFMYLRYVLPAIATGKYNDLNLTGLPQGLEEYYRKHWERMYMDDDDQDMNVKILYILVVRGDKISSNMIADILDQDIFPVENILAQWVEYVTPKKIQEADEEKTYYSIYHRSFLEFLQKQPTLDGNKNKRRFREVNQKIYEYFNG